MEKDPLVGRTIGGRFRVESLIGEGAMGRVYRARQTALGTTVALKVLHREVASIPSIEARFLREAQAASRIDHPSSVRVIDFGKEPGDDLLYMAMELLEGRSLAEILAESGPLPAARIVEIASQVLAALAVAHELGVVHRDLKPENIMVVASKDDDGNAKDLVKVCDFGIAKLTNELGSAPTVTQEGTILGTPCYMSPEQARGEALDGRSDIYAMGVLLFQMMTGEVPFDATSAFGTALMHVTDEPTKPTLLVPTVDSRLEAICLKAMRKRPEERYASARELRSELRALLAHLPMGEGPKRADSELGSIAPATLRAQVEHTPGRANRVVVFSALGGAALVAAFLFGAKASPPPAAEPPHAAQASPAAPPPAAAPLPAPKPETEGEPEPEAKTASTSAPRTPARRTTTTTTSPSPRVPATTSRVTPQPAPARGKPTVNVAAKTDEGDPLPTFIPRESPAAGPAPAPAPAPEPSPAPAPAAAPAPAPAPAAPPPLPAE